ncbi:MAG: hypothetical protein ACXWK0_02920 [Caulobacteraceae bacterium]
MERRPARAHVIGGGMKIRGVFVTVTLVLSIALGGCVSITGPVPVVDAAKSRTANDIYLNGDVVGPFNSPDSSKRFGMSPLQWRNAVVGARLDAVDQNYEAYARALRSERTSFNLASDPLALGLAGGGSVAAKSAANGLAAASAGIIAANSTLNKDAYANATVEALIAQMDAGRATVRAEIEQGLKNSDVAYRLDSALGDVQRYERAGTLERAISQVTTAANAAKVAAEANLDLVRNTQFIASTDAAVKVNDRVAGLTDAQALAVLSAMKTKLPERSNAIQENLKAIVPGLDKITDGGSAKKALQAWSVLDDRTSNFQKEWADALDAATK